jgi:hypothetical protein
MHSKHGQKLYAQPYTTTMSPHKPWSLLDLLCHEMTLWNMHFLPISTSSPTLALTSALGYGQNPPLVSLGISTLRWKELERRSHGSMWKYLMSPPIFMTRRHFYSSKRRFYQRATPHYRANSACSASSSFEPMTSTSVG